MTTMIPSEIAVHVRPLNELQVQPVAPIQEVSGEVPEFRLGQRFAARIEAALPDGTFRALVAGRSMTLSLPQTAKPGDTLDLVVLDRTSTTITAGRIATPATPATPTPPATPATITTLSTLSTLTTLAPNTTSTAPNTLATSGAPATPATLTTVATSATPAAAATAQAPDATLSQTGRLITDLLAQDRETPAAPLATRTAPLLAQPSASAAPLAPALQQAIAESGLFYEAHQAQWIAGDRSLDTLLREPQGKQPAAQNPTPILPTAVAEKAEAAKATEASATQRAEISAAKQPSGATLLPVDLQPLVQRQLDAAATQQIVWQGEIWPGQDLYWEIREERRDNPSADIEEAAQWRTQLRLVLPELGEVTATLSLGPGGLAIELAAAENASANRLRRGQTDLANALDAANVPVTLMKVVQSERP